MRFSCGLTRKESKQELFQTRGAAKYYAALSLFLIVILRNAPLGNDKF